MKIRELQPEEFYKLADNEWLPPEQRPVAGASRVIVAEVDGKIVGFTIVQLVVHIEPIWVEEKHRFGLIAKRMFERAKGFVNGRGQFICHATNEQHGGYLERLGLEKTGWSAYKGRV